VSLALTVIFAVLLLLLFVEASGFGQNSKTS